MNHFAHLVLSQPTVESTVGNLLGDFAKGIETQQLAPAILAGLHNHRAVDRFTDNHPLVHNMRRVFSSRRRRFAGIALDIYFDHLLIIHWDKFDKRNLENLIDDFYQRMTLGRDLMPDENMRSVTRRMIDYDWFRSYRGIDSVAESLDRVAQRIRFANRFDDAIEELLRHQQMISDGFVEFYPQLFEHVLTQALEKRAG